MIIAVDKYDPDRSGPFISYASMWILQTMGREQVTNNPLMYYPVHRRDLFFSVYPYLKQHGCTKCPNLSECHQVIQMIIDRTGCTEDIALTTLSMFIPFDSIDEYLECVEAVYEETPYFCKTHKLLSYDGEKQVIETVQEALISVFFFTPISEKLTRFCGSSQIMYS